MTKKNKNKKFKFKKKKIDYPENNPIEELMNLYQEEEDDIEDQVYIEEEKKENENEENDSTMLKGIIESKRKKRRRNILIVIFFILLIFAGAALTGFLYFEQLKPKDKESIDITILGPDKIKIGETFEYKIVYKNTGDIKLINNRLSVQYPHGFIVEKTSPETANHSWQIDSLGVLDAGEIKITGKIIDDLSIEQKLNVNFTYTPENFNSEFTKNSSYSSFIEAPNINIENNTLANVSLGQKFEIKTDLKNTGEIAYQDIKIIYTYPEDFELLTTKPEAVEEYNTWQWPILDINLEEQPTVMIEGNFPGDLTFDNDEDRLKKFSYQLLMKGVEDQYYPIMTEEFEIKIIDQAITSYLIINGSAGNRNIELGENLTFTVVAKNSGDQEYENIKVKAIIASDPIDIFDWDNIDDETLGKIENTDQGKVITWTKDQIEDLSTFSPKDENLITFNLPIKSLDKFTAANMNALKEVAVNALTEIDISTEDSPNIPPIKSSNIDLTLNTDLNLVIKGMYYFNDGTPLGTGPMPPVVGEKTKIQVFWDISNNLHEIENIQISTDLPPYVKWAGNSQAETGEIKYDSDERKITWTINRMPETVNVTGSNFAIEFIPEEDHLDQIIKLTGITTISARDKKTEDTIVKTKNIITSALEYDENVTGEGVVVAEAQE